MIEPKRLLTTIVMPIAITIATLLLVAPVLAEEPREIEWLDLMPAEEADAWLSEAAEVDHSGFDAPEPFQSDIPVPEFDGQSIRIPGFVVPVETDGKGKLREFFLVPYFGACIHVPPPPTNQIIYGRLEEPLPMVDIWDAFWMEGTLNVEDVSNDTADSVYTMDVDRLVLY